MKLRKFLCWMLGHKWDEIVCPPYMAGRYVCRRCRIIGYRSR